MKPEPPPPPLRSTADGPVGGCMWKRRMEMDDEEEEGLLDKGVKGKGGEERGGRPDE